MRQKTFLLYGILVLLIAKSMPTSAQYSLDQFSLDGDIRSWYDQAIGKNKNGLLSGQYEEIARQSRESHQFFETDQWRVSTFQFAGEVYDSVLALYDIQRDLLLIKHPTDFRFHSQAIRLPQTKIAWFQLNGRTFINHDEKLQGSIHGFMEELFIGDSVGILAKHSKHIETERSINFEQTDKYLLHYRGEYHRITGKGTFLRAMKSQKTELKRFIRANNLMLKGDLENEQDIWEFAQYCNQLLTNQ